MLTKGMDREKAQMFLQQSIAQMCKVTVSFTGPIEIDGIICITGRDKDDLVLVKLHEKLTSPAVPDLDASETCDHDDECALTPDLCNESVSIVREVQERFKTEISYCESGDVVCTSGAQQGEDCTNVPESGTDPVEQSDTCSLTLNIDDIKVEPVLLDSDYEDGVNVAISDNSETYESIDSCSTKRKGFADLDPTDSNSKLVRLHSVGESTELSTHTVSQAAIGTLRLSTCHTDRTESQLNTSCLSGRLCCNRCHEVFSEFVTLREHARCMHQLYVCEQCMQLFTHISSLHRHMQLHCDTVNWLCTICQHKFRRKEHLSHHIACHFDMQLHQCGQCSKGFKVRSRLQVHLERQHGGMSQHLCKPCFMEFTEAATFAEHQQRHAEFTVKYVCEQCGFIGADRLSLINHSIIHFGLRIDTSEQQ